MNHLAGGYSSVKTSSLTLFDLTMVILLDSKIRPVGGSCAKFNHSEKLLWQFVFSVLPVNTNIQIFFTFMVEGTLIYVYITKWSTCCFKHWNSVVKNQ